MNETDVGKYRVSAIATFQNGTYTEQFTDNFILTIRNDNPFIPEPFDGDLIDILDIVSKNTTTDEDLPDIRQVVYGTELAETFTPDQPIPYIRDLTTTGLLCIEWDRPMTEPDDP